MIGCDGWTVPIKDPPMNWTDHPAHKPKPIKTSFPLLFISNTKDPVTPKAAGLAMAAKFKDAGFLEQKSEGHCSISSVSLCTIEKIRAYFRDGKVPASPNGDSWEKCERDEEPWRPFDSEYWMSDNAANYGADEVMVLARSGAAWKEMQVQAQTWSFFGLEKLVNRKLRVGDIGEPGMERF
jgi:TAP-like protein